MKTTLCHALITLCLAFYCSGETITFWDFNSPVPDGTTTTGSNTPANGAGEASLQGGVSSGYASGDGSADPKTVDDTAWSTDDYPGGNVANKTAGVRFDVSTVGYTNVVVRWSQRNSNTASRYFRFQYTLDGVTFVDLSWFASLNSNFTNRMVDLSGVPGVANNPEFGFRIVAEFEYTALNQGEQNYVATSESSTYSTGGTVRFDMVEVSGTPLPGSNTAPFITSLNPQTVRVGETSMAQNFMVLDAESPAAALEVRGETSAPQVVPIEGIEFGGTGRDRTVRVKGGELAGVSTVTVYVRDPGGREAGSVFEVTVLPGNLPPVIAVIGPTNTLSGQPVGPIPFTVGDAETPAGDISIAAFSAAPALVALEAIALAGSGSNRTVTLQPGVGAVGVAPIRLTASDGTNVTESLFALMIRPSPEVLFFDPFDYSDGSLLTNSAFLWANRSGVDGQCQVSGSRLLLVGATGEDVVGRIPGEPFGIGSNALLYASFLLEARALPKSTPGLFAHFADGTSTRGRVLAGTTNASPGCFRLFVQNATASGVPPAFERDLATNQQYRVVIRYGLDTPATRLWVDPVSEADPAVNAVDTPTAGKVNYFGFRQDSDVGATLLIDDFRVGRNWAAVTDPSGGTSRPVLVWVRSGAGLSLQWPESGYVLQTATNVSGPYLDLPGASSPHPVSTSGGGAYFRLKK